MAHEVERTRAPRSPRSSIARFVKQKSDVQTARDPAAPCPEIHAKLKESARTKRSSTCRRSVAGRGRGRTRAERERPGHRHQHALPRGARASRGRTLAAVRRAEVAANRPVLRGAACKRRAARPVVDAREGRLRSRCLTARGCRDPAPAAATLVDAGFEERIGAYLKSTEEWAPPDRPQPGRAALHSQEAPRRVFRGANQADVELDGNGEDDVRCPARRAGQRSRVLRPHRGDLQFACAPPSSASPTSSSSTPKS
jgi:hypothetical protein